MTSSDKQMNRRTFIKKSAMLGAGISLAGAALSRVSWQSTESMMLEIICDSPDQALHNLNKLAASLPVRQNIQVQQLRCTGMHTGDIVFTSNNQLIDYRTSKTAFAGELAGLARKLDLPRKIQDPVLLQLSASNGNFSPDRFDVFIQGKLVERLDLSTTEDNIIFESQNGVAHVEVKDGTARIVEASCRHKTCMKLGAISKAGQSLTCIPNEIRISLSGKRVDDVDAIVA